MTPPNHLQTLFGGIQPMSLALLMQCSVELQLHLNTSSSRPFYFNTSPTCFFAPPNLQKPPTDHSLLTCPALTPSVRGIERFPSARLSRVTVLLCCRALCGKPSTLSLSHAPRRSSHSMLPPPARLPSRSHTPFLFFCLAHFVLFSFFPSPSLPFLLLWDWQKNRGTVNLRCAHFLRRWSAGSIWTLCHSHCSSSIIVFLMSCEVSWYRSDSISHTPLEVLCYIMKLMWSLWSFHW